MRPIIVTVLQFVSLALILSLQLSLPAFGETTSSKCAQLLAESALNEEQATSILAAIDVQKDIQFRVLNKSINGEMKTVVILGETHIAAETDVEAAKPVVDSFRVAATENGSTNYDPPYEYKVLPLASLLILPKALTAMVLSGRSSRSSMSLPLESSKVRKLFSAERNHKPSLSEELNILGLASVEAADWYCQAVCVIFSAVALRDVESNLIQFSLAGGYYLFSKFVLTPIIQKTAFRMPLVRNRDKTMTKNVDEYLSKDSSEKSLLVIVGLAHLKNMVQYLKENYGFRETKLEQNPTSF